MFQVREAISKALALRQRQKQSKGADPEVWGLLGVAVSLKEDAGLCAQSQRASRTQVREVSRGGQEPRHTGPGGPWWGLGLLWKTRQVPGSSEQKNDMI